MNNFYIPYNNGYFGIIPFLPPNCDKPPTIYSILETIVNGDVDLNDPAPDVKIKDLAKKGRTTIFNFDYPLSSNISKEDFEILILNHYLMRRINFDTVTAFKIQLCAKLNEIMPKYNKLFDSLKNWDIFNDGETTTRTGSDDSTSNSSSSSNSNTSNNLENKATNSTENISDRRMSDTPQNQLSDVRNGIYVTEYNYDTNTTNSNDNSSSKGTSTNSLNNSSKNVDNKIYKEEINRTPADKIRIYEEMQNNVNSIYSMIFNDLDDLFYGLV